MGAPCRGCARRQERGRLGRASVTELRGGLGAPQEQRKTRAMPLGGGVRYWRGKESYSAGAKEVK